MLQKPPKQKNCARFFLSFVGILFLTSKKVHKQKSGLRFSKIYKYTFFTILKKGQEKQSC